MILLTILAACLAAQDLPYSKEEIADFHKVAEELVAKGRYFQAAAKLNEVKKARIPAADLPKLAEAEKRVAHYAGLLLETTAGDTAKVPLLMRIAIKNGGKPLGRIIKDDGTFLHYETLTGIRSRLAKEQIDTLTGLTPGECAAEVLVEFKRQCGNRSLMLLAEPGKPPAWKELGGKRLAGSQYFALAEFCARNGAGEFLTGLFDLAVQRDPEIRATAHAAKGERLVNQLFYSLTVNQMPQANYSLDALTSRYRDTAPYKDKLYADKEITEIVKVLLKKDIPEPKQPPKPPPPPAETAKAPDPAPNTPAAPAPPVVEAPPPLIVGPAPEVMPEPAPGSGPLPVTTFRLPSGTPPEIQEMVAKGDKNFDEAMRHLLASDPGANPDGWSKENAAALELFRKANVESYLPAQDKYSSGVPQPLLDRVRECTMRTSLCRKRSIRHD